MPNPQLGIKSTDRLAVAGMPGMGKTTFAEWLAKGYVGQGIKVKIFDPLHQYKVPKAELVYPSFNEAADLEVVCKKSWQEGNQAIFMEEAELYIKEHGRMLPWTSRMALRGRNRGVGLVAITRRIANLSKTYFSLCDHVFVFRHFSPNDVNYLVEFLGKEHEKTIRTLKPYHFLHYHQGEVKLCPPVEV